MNKNTFPIVIIAVILVLLFGGYFVYSKFLNKPIKNGNEVETSNTKEEEIKENKETSMSGSILDLINAGKTQKCTFSYSQDKMETKGTTYLSGKKMKGDFESTINDQKMQSHVISDGEYFYMWSEGMPSGFKMKISDTEKNTDAKSNQAEQLKSLQGKYDYKCSPWVAVGSTFEAPTNVTFSDFSQMMKPNNGSGVNMCATCDLIQEAEGRTQCKTQFKCQ